MNAFMCTDLPQRVGVPRKLKDYQDDEDNCIDDRSVHYWLGGFPFEIDSRGEASAQLERERNKP